MVRDQPSHVVLLLAVLALVGSSLVPVAAYHAEPLGSHNVDLVLEQVRVVRPDTWDPADPDGNLSGFLHPDGDTLDLVVQVRNDNATSNLPTDSSRPRNVSVWVQATWDAAFGQGDVLELENSDVDDDECFFLDEWPADQHTVNFTRTYAVSPGDRTGNLTFEAHVNDPRTEEHCGVDEWNEANDPNEGSTSDDKLNNRARTNVSVRGFPDLDLDNAVGWCWNKNHPDTPEGRTSETGNLLCPDGRGVNSTNPTWVRHYNEDPETGPPSAIFFRVRAQEVGPYPFTVPVDASENWTAPYDEPAGEGLFNGTQTDPLGIQHPDALPAEADEALRYDLSFRVTGPDGGTWALPRTDVPYLGNVSSGALWNLSGKTPGRYLLEVQADHPSERVRETDETNNGLTFPFTVHGVDLEPAIDTSGVNTTPDDPYAEAGDHPVPLDLRNAGNLVYDPANLSFQDNATWRLTADPGFEGGLLRDTLLTERVDVGAQASFTPTLTICDAETTQGGCDVSFDHPGKHILQLRVDTADVVPEANEGDANVHTVPIFLQDSDAPVIQDWGVPSDLGQVKAGDTVLFHANVDEGDLYLDDVTLHLREQGPNGTTENVTLEDVTDETDPATDYRFELERTFAEVGTFDYWITAEDPSGNNASTLADVRTLHVGTFQVNTTVLEPDPANGTEFLKTGDDHTGQFTILANVTGTANGRPNTTGKEVFMEAPRGPLGTYDFNPYYNSTACQDPGGGNSCADYQRDWYSLGVAFREPGRWNYTVAAQDRAGLWHNQTHWFNITTPAPEITSVSITPSPGDDGVAAVDAGNTVRFEVTVEDDGGHADRFDHAVPFVHVNFTQDDLHRNVTLPLVDEEQVGDEEAVNATYALNVTTGRFGTLDHAGFHDVRVSAMDGSFNWTARDLDDQVQVRDHQEPELDPDGTGVDPTLEETDVPLEFFAFADDDTAIEVRVNVTGPEGDTVADFELEHDQINVFRAERAFSEAGEYTFLTSVEDSDGNVDSLQGSFETVANLPPNVDVLHDQVDELVPDPTLDDVFYVGPQPLLAFDIHDPSDVVQDSIRLDVDGETVNLTGDDLERRADETGYVLTWAIQHRYNDSATLPVDVYATDRSPQNRTVHRTFDLRVDDRAQDMTEVEFGPRFLPSGVVYNVSRHTKFWLNATDLDADGEDTAASGVDQVRWCVQRSTSCPQDFFPPSGDVPDRVRAQTVGPDDPFDPFQLNRSSGPLRILYAAQDRVGNVETVHALDLRVNNEGPRITHLPSGRHVNATISDPHGVTDVQLRYQPPGEPWTTAPMEQSDGLWRAVLPDVSRGQEVAYYITARDDLDNLGRGGSQDDPFVYRPGNHRPQVEFTSPDDGQEVSGTIEIAWSGSDPDPGDDVRYQLQVKLASQGRENYRELTPLNPNETSLEYDTDQLKDATYDLRVVVSDGTEVNTDIVRVTVRNAEQAASPTPVDADRINLGEELTFHAEVHKAAPDVVLEIRRGGDVVDTVPMRDDGEPPDDTPGDGVYAASYTFQESGSYTWSVNVTFQQDGEVVHESTPAEGSFTVATSVAEVVERNLGLWIAVLVLTAAAVGLGVRALSNER